MRPNGFAQPNVLMRLNVEISPKSFLVHDSISGGVVIFEDEQYKAFALDRESIIKRLQMLQSSLLSWSKVRCLRQPSDILSESERVVIREDGQESWTISCNGLSSKLANGQFKHHRKMNVDIVLSYVNKMVCQLLAADKILQPHVDIVRRIPDARLVVWNYKEHSTVCYEDGIKGATMSNCLIDGAYYDVVLVQSDEESMTCTLMTTEFDVIVEYPLDDSIKFFYADDGGEIQ